MGGGGWADGRKRGASCEDGARRWEGAGARGRNPSAPPVRVRAPRLPPDPLPPIHPHSALEDWLPSPRAGGPSTPTPR